MVPNYIYAEKLFSRINAVMFAVIVVLLLYALIYQLLAEPLGANPAPTEFFVFMILLFFAIGINFSTLRITIDYNDLNVGYGIIKKTIPREKIEKCYLDQTRAILYGGWGIRIGRVKGKWRLIYNTVGDPRVVVVLRNGWYQEFVFSTRNPQEIIKLLN